MCCGLGDDYDEPRRQRPRNPPVARTQSAQRREATRAAENYGWPRDRAGGTHRPEQGGNRDSYIEAGLAGALAGLPGSDFRQVYDPDRHRQQPQDQYQRDQYRSRSNNRTPEPTGNAYHTKPYWYQHSDQRSNQRSNQPSQAAISEHSKLKQVPRGMSEYTPANVRRHVSSHGSIHGVVDEQPRMRQGMNATPPERRRTPLNERRCSVDSNGVSFISTDSEDEEDTSPPARGSSRLVQGGNNSLGRNLYSRTGHGYGRRGAF
ncbi:hypothetical protein F5Y11DRAFT_234530 [Daldinia sp. FL1419]|nr:hypothetical protein F5Y11DRAFT_234530 [Daldinia sp. FL1419]